MIEKDLEAMARELAELKLENAGLKAQLREALSSRKETIEQINAMLHARTMQIAESCLAQHWDPQRGPNSDTIDRAYAWAEMALARWSMRYTG
jgi:hypothetical protein